jgi:hypothetical protein
MHPELQWCLPVVRPMRYAVVCFYLVAASGAQATQDPLPQGRVSLSFSAPLEVTLNTPVVLELLVTNTSREVFTVDLGPRYVFHLLFDSTGPGGIRQTVNGARNLNGEYVWHSIAVAPNQPPVSRIIVLDAFLDFPTPGAYEVTVKFTGSVQHGPNVELDLLRETTFHLTLLPRDEGVLRRLCEDLMPLVLRQKGVSQDQKEAAERLAFIRDPVAVPYLRRGVDAESSAYDLMLEALVRIGTPAAREALVELTGHGADWIAAAARRALARVK